MYSMYQKLSVYKLTWQISKNELRNKAKTYHPHVDKQTPKSILKYCRILVPEFKYTSSNN